MARHRYRWILCVGLALVASAALTPAASATSGPITCPNYHGTFALNNFVPATFTKIKASGISCRLAEKALRTAPVANSGAVVAVGGVTFTETVTFIPHGLNITLTGHTPKTSKDTVRAHVTVQ
jgi:hypothetical protein